MTPNLLNRAKAYIDLWDKTSCVEIEILTGMEDAREAYYAAPDMVRELVAEVERLSADRRLSGQANLLLARIVAAANLGAIDGSDGFIESYNLPVGPIHKAIPFLQEQGIVITEDGQIFNGPEQQHVSKGDDRGKSDLGSIGD
jgi:hypothetical protein